MGVALAVALGVAEKRPEREVVALVGDGELLMGAGSLWSLAGRAPENLVVVVLADGHYSITGGQPLGGPSRFAGGGAALGLSALTADTREEIVAALAERPALLEVRCDDGVWPGPSPFVDPPAVRLAFEQAAS